MLLIQNVKSGFYLILFIFNSELLILLLLCFFTER